MTRGLETEMTNPEELVRELTRVKRVRQDLLDPRSREALSRYVQDLEASLDAAERASACAAQILSMDRAELDAAA